MRHQYLRLRATTSWDEIICHRPFSFTVADRIRDSSRSTCITSVKQSGQLLFNMAPKTWTPKFRTDGNALNDWNRLNGFTMIRRAAYSSSANWSRHALTCRRQGAICQREYRFPPGKWAPACRADSLDS